MIKAVYPGTFDPLTRGHEDLVRRAGTLFGTLVLAIAESTAKRTFFTLEERVAMANEVLGGMKNVRFGLDSAIARTRESNSVLARRTSSSWPRVSGSNVPG